MSPVKQELLHKIEQLPQEHLDELLDYVNSLIKHATQKQDPISSVVGSLSGQPLSNASIDKELYQENANK